MTTSVENDEARITNDKRSPNDRNTKARTQTSVRHSDFVIPSSLDIRHSCSPRPACRAEARGETRCFHERSTFNFQRSTFNKKWIERGEHILPFDVERWTLNVFFRYHQIR
jgi:hypothetical protein